MPVVEINTGRSSVEPARVPQGLSAERYPAPLMVLIWSIIRMSWVLDFCHSLRVFSLLSKQPNQTKDSFRGIEC
jgi:hypothetical protein